jgi:hypothetical protein
MWKDGTRGGIWKDDLFTTMKGETDTVVLQQAKTTTPTIRKRF